jgi:hypothetical protein
VKALVVSIGVAFVLSLSSPRPARADIPGASFVLAVTPLVVQVVLDLQDAWNCYLEGFRRRHPVPRPAVPRPDSVPAAPVPAPSAPMPAPTSPAFPDVSPESSITAPAGS